MSTRLFVCVAAAAVIGCPVLFAADRSSDAKESSSIDSETAAVKKKMSKPLDMPGSFIAPKDWEFDGQIIASLKKVETLSQNDVVFVDLGSDDGVTQGTRCIIYRQGDKVRDAGIMVKFIGELEIIGGIRKNSATARILYANDIVEIGDILEIQ